jgi:DNA polymerase elongation subunit (family B)
MRSVMTILVGFLILGNKMIAQEGNAEDYGKKERFREKLEAQRIAYITNKLDLSSEESIKFWPVYNEYSKKRLEIRKENRELRQGRGIIEILWMINWQFRKKSCS